MPPGKYIRFGIAGGLSRALDSIHNALRVLLSFSVDGLSLSRSSRVELWPIQCMIQGEKNAKPFLVSVYFGESKPKSSNAYLRAFVDELKTLLEEGIQLGSRTIEVEVASFI